MDFENTLSTAADTADTPQTETGSPVIVMQSGDTAAISRSVSLDAPTLETAGLPAVVRSVFGDYHQRTQTVTETAADVRPSPARSLSPALPVWIGIGSPVCSCSLSSCGRSSAFSGWCSNDE